MSYLKSWLRLVEGSPHRLVDPSIVEWIEDAKRRPDANALYVHGSPKQFSRFTQPNTDHGQLIFTSKLIGETRPDQILQAEYYGHNLYLVKINYRKEFSPLNDKAAAAILAEALVGEPTSKWSDDGEHRIQTGVYDYTAKVRWGRLDYQDLHLVIPPAVEAGYDLFRVYEVAMKACSYAAISPDMMTIVDTHFE